MALSSGICTPFRFFMTIQPSKLNLGQRNVISTSKKYSKHVDIEHMLQSKRGGGGALA